MKISALAQRTGVAVGTIKFYLREGVVPPGRATSRTTAEYDEAHVERIRLVRALTDSGGLGIAAVRRIIAAIEAPDPARLDVLATAQDALLDGQMPTGAALLVAAPSTGTAPVGRAASVGGEASVDGEASAGAAAESGPAGSRARAWALRRGWSTYPDDQLVARLDRVWRACELAGITVDEDLLDDYAEAMEAVACLDVESVPLEADGAVRRVVVGTVMLEPVLSTLRMLAQREISVRRDPGERGVTCP